MRSRWPLLLSEFGTIGVPGSGGSGRAGVAL